MRWKTTGVWTLRALWLLVIGFFAYYAFHYARAGDFSTAKFTVGLALITLVSGLWGPLDTLLKQPRTNA